MRRRDVILNELEGMIKKHSNEEGSTNPTVVTAFRQHAILEVLLDIRDLLAPKEEEEEERSMAFPCSQHLRETVAVYWTTSFPETLDRQTHYAGLSFGTKPDEVMYIKGYPHSVIAEDFGLRAPKG